MSLKFRKLASALTWLRAGQADGCHSGGAPGFFRDAAIGAAVSFLAMIPVNATARPSGQQRCREQPAVQQLLKQAGDTTQPYEGRRKAYERASRACSRDASIDSALAELLLEHQDAQAALAWARRGLIIAPTDADLKVYEGIALLLLGHPDQALEILKAAPSTGKNQFYLGMAYRALRQHQDAQQAFSKAFELGFNDPYVLYALIEQDHALGDKEAGLRDFKTLYQHFPDSPWLHMLYGDAYMAKNDNVNAQTEYQQVAKMAPNLPVVQYQLGYLDFVAARYADAAEHFRREIATNPAFASAYLYLGTTLRRLNRNPDALPYLKQAVARDPNYYLAYSELATAQEQAGQTEDALGTLKTAEKRFPQEPAFPAQAAGLLRSLNRPQAAKIEGEKATQLSQKNNPIQHGDAEHGVPVSPDATVEGSADSPSPDARGSSEPAPSGQRANASAPPIVGMAGQVGISGVANTSSQSLAPTLRPLAECIDRSDSQCAAAAMAALPGPIKSSGDYWDLAAQTYMLQRNRDQALAAIHQALIKDPNQYNHLITEGRIYQSFNDQVSAVRIFLLADRARPHTAETYYFLGMSFFLSDEYARAANHFQHALELDPGNHRSAFMLGVVNMITFRLTEAKPYFEEALKQQPGNPFYHLHYGILLSRMGDNDGALVQVQLAAKLDPSYALTHYNLGHLYKDKGDLPGARQELETAIKLRPGLAEAYYQLGSVYHHLGMEADSRRAYAEFQKTKAEQLRQLQDPVESNVLRHEPEN